MDGEVAQDEQALRAQLEQARERLDELANDLRSVDHEFEELAEEREQYRLLGKACDALDELSVRGAAALFWGEAAAGREGDDHVRLARGRLGVFEERLTEIDDRRQKVLEAIRREEANTEIIADDLFEVRRQEEERKLQWVIEREIGDLPARASIMPWTRGGADDQRFRKSLALSLLVSLTLGGLLPLVDLPLPERWEPIEVPDRLTRLIREERPPPPPVTELAKPEEVEPKPEESPAVAEETKVPPKPKESVGNKGILAFREKFSGLATSKAPARLGSQARIRGSGNATRGRATRNMVATLASGSSGGIDLGSLSRDIGGGGGQGIEGVQVTRVTSSIGGVGGTDRPLSGGPASSRTDEEIQIVFDRHKAALYRLYNRELRRDPTLQGQMTLRIRIEPDGSVSLCMLQTTDMDAPRLTAQVVERVKTFDFGAKDGIPPITILYPIDFLPAA